MSVKKKNLIQQVATLNGIKSIIYYIVIFILSLMTINNIPFTSIAILSAIYSANLPLAKPAIVSIAALLLINPISTLVLIVYLLFFITTTIVIKPLVALENRFEQKKIENYIIFLIFAITFYYFGIINALGISLLILGIYKVMVNGLPVLKSDERLVYSNEEVLSFNIVFLFTLNIINSILRVNILLLSVILAILGYNTPRRGIKFGMIISIISIVIYNLTNYYEFLNSEKLVILVAPIIFYLISIVKKDIGLIIAIITNIIAVLVLKIDIFFAFAIGTLIVLYNLKKNSLEQYNINKKNMLTDEGEKRLENSSKNNIKNDTLNSEELSKINNLDEKNNKKNIFEKLKKLKNISEEKSSLIYMILKDKIKKTIHNTINVDLEIIEKEYEIEVDQKKLDKLYSVYSTSEDIKVEQKVINKIREEVKEELKNEKQEVKASITNKDIESELKLELLKNKYLLEVKENIVNSEEVKEELSIYDEIVYYDDVINQIYIKIVKNNYIMLEKQIIYDILLNNNIIMDKNSIEFIKITEILNNNVTKFIVNKYDEIKEDVKKTYINNLFMEKEIELFNNKLEEKKKELREENKNIIKEKIKSNSISIKKIAKDKNKL